MMVINLKVAYSALLEGCVLGEAIALCVLINKAEQKQMYSAALLRNVILWWTQDLIPLNSCFYLCLKRKLEMKCGMPL